MNRILVEKVKRVVTRKAESLAGRLLPIYPTLEAMAVRPFELHLELTNLCNADCIFCPYQFQQDKVQFMPDEVFEKAVNDYVQSGGGSVGLTPIVGDALIDPKFVKRVQYLRQFNSIDRIWLTTNAILLDKHGIDNVLDCGLTSITISTAGFDQAMYERVYRNQAYQRMRRNVLSLVEKNSQRVRPLNLHIGLRSDRPLKDVMKDPDFQPILKFNPHIDFTWAFTSAGGRITGDMLPAQMKLRKVTQRREACVQTYNGPIVLPDGTVQGCTCVAAMDASHDLGLGNIMEDNLVTLWHNMKPIRAAFGTAQLNKTCAGCDMYRDLEVYRTREGRERARINTRRLHGETVHREEATTAFNGG